MNTSAQKMICCSLESASKQNASETMKKNLKSVFQIHKLVKYKTSKAMFQGEKQTWRKHIPKERESNYRIKC